MIEVAKAIKELTAAIRGIYNELVEIKEEIKRQNDLIEGGYIR